MKDHLFGSKVEFGSQIKTGGYTLIELMIAIFVLVVGLFSMASLAISVIKGNNFSKQMTTAATLGQKRLEAKRVMAFASITSATDNYNTIPGYGSFKRVVTVPPAINITPPYGARYKTVTVDTFWAGDMHQVRLQTIVAE